MNKVLIAYATSYGSTREVAEKVAAILSGRGIETTVRPAKEVDSLDGMSGVILGGALYFFRAFR